MDETARFRKNLREISWAQGMTVKDVRDKSGVRVRFDRVPSKALLKKLSSVLQVDPAVFLQKNAVRHLYGEYSFQENLRSLVSSTGKTTPEVARDLHVGKTTIYMWLNESRMPQPGMVRQISDYFGITTMELLFEHNYGEVING